MALALAPLVVVKPLKNLRPVTRWLGSAVSLKCLGKVAMDGWMCFNCMTVHVG